MMEAFRNVFRSSTEKKEARAKVAAAKAEADANKSEDVFAHGIETLFDKNRGEPIEFADADVFNDNRYVDYSEQKKALRKVETSVRKEQKKLIGITDSLTDEKDSGSEKEKMFDETEKNDNGKSSRRWFSRSSKAKKELSNQEKEENWRDINVFSGSEGVQKKNLDDYVNKDDKNSRIEKETIKNALKTLEVKKSGQDKVKVSVAPVKSKETVTTDSKTVSKAVSKEKKSIENELKSSKIVDSKKKETEKVPPTQDTKTKTVTTKTVTKKTPTSPTEKVVKTTERQKSVDGKPVDGKPVAKAASKEKVTNVDKMKKNTDNTDQVKGAATVVKSQPGVRSVRTSETTITKTSSPAKKVSSEVSSTVRTVTTSSRTSSSSVVKRSSTDPSTKSSTSVSRRSSVTAKGDSKSPTKEAGARTTLNRQTSAGSQSRSSTGSHGNSTTTVTKATGEKGKAATGTPSRTGAQRPSSIVVESSSSVRKVTTVKRSTSGAGADLKKGSTAKK